MLTNTFSAGGVVTSEAGSQRDNEGTPLSFEATKSIQIHDTTKTNVSRETGNGSAAERSERRRPNLRPSSVTGSSQRISSANRDNSVTQFALIDDDNVSQQVTRGGGALTLASQWKSQFDDSEETDNEWKQDQQSPDHGIKSSRGPNSTVSASKDLKKRDSKKNKNCFLNIAGIENYPNLQRVLPHCWSDPALSNTVRCDLQPPLLQQAAFDDIVYKLDIMRNIAHRESNSESQRSSHRNSLPNIMHKYSTQTEDTLTKLIPQPPPFPPIQSSEPKTDKCDIKNQDSSNNINDVNNFVENVKEVEGDKICFEECAISGRLEIRVVSQCDNKTSLKNRTPLKNNQSPNPDDSVYFDAIANDGIVAGNVINHNIVNINQIDAYNSDIQLKAFENKNLNSLSLHNESFKKDENVENVFHKRDISEHSLGTNEIVNNSMIQLNNTNNSSSFNCIKQNDLQLRRENSTGVSSGGLLSGSKIPIFNQNLRISKCASWAGGTDFIPNNGLMDLTPGKQNLY